MYHHLQTSFNGGELSPRLQSRVDIEIYAKSAAEILNMVPTVEGALLKRSGTRYRAAALSTTSFRFRIQCDPGLYPGMERGQVALPDQQ